MSMTPKVEPENVHLDTEGFHTRSIFVRLPADICADDLKDPAIWSKVQSSRSAALRLHDRLYIVGHANTFAVEARVTRAAQEAVVLALQKLISFPERLTPLFSDDKYRVAWATEGYSVERISDGVQVGGVVGSEALAVRQIKQLYQVRA